ncbi:MAG: hypothetical protein ABSH35_11375 [Isosphaeraceae bacterium]
MSGAESLKGLVYQQAYASFRVLNALSQKVLEADLTGPVLTEFLIEGRTTSDAPIWDIHLAFSDGGIDFHECKDTTISREDRHIFYKRLRRQIASGTSAKAIRPVWVTNPDKQTENALMNLEGLASEISRLDLETLPALLPDRGSTARELTCEAVFKLCHEVESDDPLRPCTFEEAKELLSSIRVACHRLEELEQGVALLATGLFTKGTGRAIDEFITGVLTKTIANHGKARFTVDEFLNAVGTTAFELEVEGRIRKLLSFHTAKSYRPHTRLVTWRNLQGSRQTRWELMERVPDYDVSQSSLLVAGMGIGKTVASEMAFEEQGRLQDPRRVIRVEARSLDVDDLDALVRLSCMLSGIGRTWLAVDGLDEFPLDMRTAWEHAFHAMLSLAGMTILATVRREVLIVRDWLSEMTSALLRVEINPLGAAEVEKAFKDVGLPIPTNKLLVRALQNPFLLSLYADVVTADDMPLAESGEVTAFRVVDEFWRRRVSGISIGMRAVGDSEGSQAPKRTAAVYLGEQNLAGATAVARSPSNPELHAGIEMLIREGVLREQGTDSVAWIHEWFREYAILDRLMSGLDELTPVTLARQVTTSEVDHVARAAAAGAVKWLASSPTCGSVVEYLVELWSRNTGLAREALSVLLEGDASSFKLSDLSDELLLEAVVLASHLRATQWVDEIATLHDERFLGAVGDRLHENVVRYELTVAPHGQDPKGDAVRRSVARDLRRCHAGCRYPVHGTFVTLVKSIISAKVFSDSGVHEWLVAVGRLVNGFHLGEVLRVAKGMAESGELQGAYRVFAAGMGIEDVARGELVSEALSDRRGIFGEDRGIFGEDVGEILRIQGLISGHVGTWGKAAVKVLADLIRAGQKRNWPSSMKYHAAVAQALCVSFDADKAFEPSYDEDPRASCFDRNGEHRLIVQVTRALETGFREAAELEDPIPFRELSTEATLTRFAGCIAIPILVLYDALRKETPEKVWYVAEALRLLKDARVAALGSLSDARRLLRRSLPETLTQTEREEITAAVRSSNLEPMICLEELSDLRNWGVLTSEESSALEQAISAHKIGEPDDLRDNPLFGECVWREPVHVEEETGWPHLEDEHAVKMLANWDSEPQQDAKSGGVTDQLKQRLDALRTVMSRGEATSEKWVGHSLRWCRQGIEQLRRAVEEGCSNGPGA